MNKNDDTTVPPIRPLLSGFAKLLVVLTLILIFMGGHVKSHEAGLSVPDWPGTYGQNMFTYPPSLWTGGIFYEHTHRLFAFFVSVWTGLLMVWVLVSDSRSWVRKLSVLTSGAIIAQALLGGLTVLLQLPAWTSISHGVLAQTFFMLTILLAYTLSTEWRKRSSEAETLSGNPVLKPAILLTVSIYVQLILGALLRHTESGLALPDFPTMAGQWVPMFTQDSVSWVNAWLADYSLRTGYFVEDITLAQLWIHFFHRLGAIFVVVALVALCRRAKQTRDQFPQLWNVTLWLMGLIAVQVILGISTVLTQRLPIVTSIHVVVGAAILGVSWFLLLRSMPLTLWQESMPGDDVSLSEVSET